MLKHAHLGLLIAATRRGMKQAVSTLIADEGVSHQQFWTLVAVAEQPQISLGAMAERRHMDQPTASRVVFGLRQRGLVRSSVDPSDRRSIRLALTPAGRALAVRLRPVAARIRNTVDGSLTSAEREAVASGLSKVLAALDRLSDERAGETKTGGRRQRTRGRTRSA